MKCQDISARLVDFLYGEIAPAERAEFDAHLVECPTCAAEVKASSRALQRTRTALRGPLNEEPPARVHANILAAARAAAQPARKPTLAEKEGFFARLWKAPWLLPAMGAASVATAVFLIKVIKDPEILPVREAESPTMEARPRPAQVIVPAPVAPTSEPQAEAEPVTRQDQGRMAVPGKRERGLAKRAASRSKPAAAAPKAAKAPSLWAEPPPPRGPSEAKDRAADRDDLALKESVSGAVASKPRSEVLQAQPQMAAEAPRPAPAPPVASPYAPAPSAAPAQQAPESVEYHAKTKRAAEAKSMEEELFDSAPSRSADKQAGRAVTKSGAAQESFEERVRKADRLYEEEKWSEAAAAYRALLEQAPRHPAAPTWRQRFLLAERAHKAGPALKAKSKTSNEALDGM